MELGNMIFGNSRGDFPIERGIGYEEQLERLFEAYAPDRDNSWREYGERFENDTFEVFPYYWDDECTCGFDELDAAWDEANPHKPECYQTALAKGRAANQGRADDALYTRLCAEYGVPFPDGCAVHCTCGCDEEYAKWGEAHDHDPECLLVKPNFLYKPTGFSVSWYKYPLRDSYTSEQLTVAQFTAIIDKCIESLEA